MWYTYDVNKYSAPDKQRNCIVYARKIGGYAKKITIKRNYNAILFTLTQIVLKTCVNQTESRKKTF